MNEVTERLTKFLPITLAAVNLMASASSPVEMTSILGGRAMHCPTEHVEKAPGRPPSISDIDWCNFSYPLFELRRGRAELREYPPQGGHDTTTLILKGVVYGDADGDGQQEAVVAISQDIDIPSATGTRSSSSTKIYIYAWRSHKPVLLGTLHESVPVSAIGFAPKKLFIESGDASSRVTRGYAWHEGRFVPLD